VKISRIAVAALGLTAAAGCGKNNSIIGTWSDAVTNQPYSISFQQGDAFTSSTLAKKDGKTRTMRVSGSYSESGDQLILTYAKSWYDDPHNNTKLDDWFLKNILSKYTVKISWISENELMFSFVKPFPYTYRLRRQSPVK